MLRRRRRMEWNGRAPTDLAKVAVVLGVVEEEKTPIDRLTPKCHVEDRKRRGEGTGN